MPEHQRRARLLASQFTELSDLPAKLRFMQELLDLIRANPWPFAGGLIAVVVAILAENFGRGGDGTEFPDMSWDD